MAPTKEFKCKKCDKEYCFEKDITSQINKNHDEKVPKRVTNLTMASKPAPIVKKNFRSVPNVILNALRMMC